MHLIVEFKVFENTNFLGKGKKVIKNIIKKLFFPKFGYPSWHYVIDQTPLLPDEIIQILPTNTRLLTYNDGFVNIDKKSRDNKFEEYSRIIFLLVK